MASRFLVCILFVILVNNQSIGQIKSYSEILPKGIVACPILDSANYLPDSLKQIVYSTLKQKGFDLTKCFVDKRIWFDEKENKVEIIIWDIDYLIESKNLEKSSKKHKIMPSQITHSGYYGGEIVYDINTKTAIFNGDQ